MPVCYFYIFCIQKIFTSLLQHKKLLESTLETFLAYIMVLDNLYEVSGCSIITDFILTKFAFSGFQKFLVGE